MLDRVKAWDERVLVKISKKRTPKLNKIMIFVSTIGNGGLVWFAFSIPFLFMNRWRLTGFTMLFAMCIAWLCGEIGIKHLVGRVRPCNKCFEKKDLLIKNPPQYSFPSGHTTSSFAITTVTLIMCTQVFIPVFLFSCLMGFSRMYLLVHYPTDVFAGIILGAICAVISVMVCGYIPIFTFQV